MGLGHRLGNFVCLCKLCLTNAKTLAANQCVELNFDIDIVASNP